MAPPTSSCRPGRGPLAALLYLVLYTLDKRKNGYIFQTRSSLRQFLLFLLAKFFIQSLLPLFSTQSLTLSHSTIRDRTYSLLELTVSTTTTIFYTSPPHNLLQDSSSLFQDAVLQDLLHCRSGRPRRCQQQCHLHQPGRYHSSRCLHPLRGTR